MLTDTKPAFRYLGPNLEEIVATRKNYTEDLFTSLEFNLRNRHADLAKTDLARLKKETAGLYFHPDPTLQFVRQIQLDHLYDARIADLEKNPALAHVHARGVLLSLGRHTTDQFPQFEPEQAAPVNEAWDLYIKTGLQVLPPNKWLSLRHEAQSFLSLSEANPHLQDRLDIIKQQIEQIDRAIDQYQAR